MNDREFDRYIEETMKNAEIPAEVEARIAKVTAAVRLSAGTDPERILQDNTDAERTAVHAAAANRSAAASEEAYNEKAASPLKADAQLTASDEQIAAGDAALENKESMQDDPVISDIQNVRTSRPSRKTSGRRTGSRRWRGAALAAALVACTGFTAFAAAKLWQFRVDQQAPHQIEVTLSADETAASSSQSAEPAEAITEVPSVMMEISYLPEGLIDNSDEKGQISYKQADDNGGYFIGNPIILDMPVSSWTEKFVTEYETLSIGGKDAVYTSKQNGLDSDWLWKDLYILYPEVNRIVQLTAWGYAPKEELIRIGEGIVMTKGEDMIPVDGGLPTWSQIMANKAAMVEDAANTVPPEEKTTATTAEMANLHELGEKAVSEVWQEGVSYPISVKALEVQTADDFSLLNADYIPEEWNALLTADGKLGTATRKYYTDGDGVNTFPELVSEEEVGLKLVEVTLEYTNESDQDLTDVLFYTCLLRLSFDEPAGQYQVIAPDLKGADNVDYAWHIGGDEMQYFDVTGGDRNNNYIPSLKAGESQIIHVAWILFEDEADQLYLATDGSGHFFTEDMLETGLIRLP